MIEVEGNKEAEQDEAAGLTSPAGYLFSAAVPWAGPALFLLDAPCVVP